LAALSAFWGSNTNSLVDESYAVGQKTTFNFSYDLLNRGSPDALTFDLVVEDRGPIGTELPPLFGGLASGSIVPPAVTWGDFDLGITQAYIRQSLFNNHFQYTVGKVFAPNYLNAYPFFDDNRQFLNQTFSTGPTIASPLRGFGAVAAWYPTDTGLYLQSGIYTANSSDTGSTIKDFFTNDEHFYHFDIGWSGLAQTGTPINARGPMDANNVHVTLWHKDKQDSGSPEAEGAAFNVNYMVDDNVMVFLRGGLSDGWFVDRNLSAGFGWRPDNGTNDLFGLGAGWAHPSSDALDSQYTAEAFYRYQLTPNLALTPDLQMIVNPSLAPDVDVLWVASVRARVTF